MTRKTTAVATSVAGSASAMIAAALWWRAHPSACPYGQRFWVAPPHPFITRARLRQALSPAPGQRILEVGPGTGYYTLAAADWVGPSGVVDILDVQQEMLNHTIHRAQQAGLRNVHPALGDARSLPYERDSLDAAYMVAVLGEVPDRVAALRELARVVKPGGSVVIGELFGDPHGVASRTLRRDASAAGLTYEHRNGRLLGHYTVFTAPNGPRS